MKPIYTEKQNGSWILVLLIAALIPILVIYTGSSDEEWTIGTSIFILFMIAVAWLFFRLKTEIYSDHIRLSFGIGVISKNIELNRVKSVERVRNKWYYGWGIRFIGKGWLWNIWGLDAVELTFNDKKSVFRIGSQEADILKNRIEQQLKPNNQ
jgi:hypothetical protein